jgi:hypothetical protein
MESVVGLEPRAIWTRYMHVSLCERIHEWWRGDSSIVTCNRKALPKRGNQKRDDVSARTCYVFRLRSFWSFQTSYWCLVNATVYLSKETFTFETVCRVLLTICSVNISHHKAESIKMFATYCGNYKWSTDMYTTSLLNLLRTYRDSI